MLDLPHPTHWTPELLEQLSAEFRYEVREGNLVIMAAASRVWHADAQARIWRLLTQRGHHAYIEQGVVLPGAEIRTCDIGIFDTPPPADRAYHEASAFALVVEVVSDGSRREDREVKPKIYAQAGIPAYWRVEEDSDGGAVVYQYELRRFASTDDATYAEVRVASLSALESEPVS